MHIKALSCFALIAVCACPQESQKTDATTVDSGAKDAASNDATSTDRASGDITANDAATNDATTTSDATINSDASANNDAGANPTQECLDWQTTHPEWLWCDDFEQEQNINTNYNDTSDNGMAITDQDPYRGTYSLRQHYSIGQVDAGWISKFYGDTLGNDYGPIQDHFYMRWYHKFEAGFQGTPPKMARITSIGPNWDKRFGVYYWIDNGEIVADVHAEHGWIPIQRTGFFYTEPANIGRWTCHELYVKANTPGLSDGAYAIWVDGQKLVDVTNVDLVGNTDYHFNNVMLDCYWNGGSPAEQNRYYDNFVISTEPIGCGVN